ncbi:MAG: biotin--[acetyl-CoA-carboxylase] ligase, partial [bacterium]
HQLRALSGDGYRLKRLKRSGVRLVSEPDRLFPERILRGLETNQIGKKLYAFQTIGSTNDRALFMGERGEENGTVWVTEGQTHGRGRQGRSWMGTEGKGLAFSVIFRFSLSAQEASGFTLAAAVAVALTLEESKVRPRIKWPNDVYLGGRKICGVLTETRGGRESVHFTVVGIGVNLNQAPGDFSNDLKSRATSYYRHTGRKLDRVVFFQRLLFHLEKMEGWIRKKQFPRILSQWRRRSLLNHRQVRVVTGDRTFYGQAVGVDESGALLVRNDFGLIEKVLAGEVELLRLSNRKRPRERAGTEKR